MTDIESKEIETGLAAGAQAPEATRPALPKALAAFQYRNYQLWFGGQLVSLAGTWMQSIAQGWLVYQISRSEFALGLVGFAGAIPILFITPWGGVVVDRVPKRTLLVITQIVMMVLAFALAILYFLNVVQVWHIVVMAALLGVANSFDAPARQAFVVEMVGREHLVNGIAMNSIMFNGARVVGPALGGLLLAAVGAGWCFFFNGVSFLAVIAGLLAMRIPAALPKPPQAASAWQQLKDGIAYTAHHTDILSLLGLAAVFGVFGFSYSALLPAFVDLVFHAGANGFGFLNAAVGLGAVTGAFLVAQYVDRTRRGTWVVIANIGFSVLLILFAFNQNFPLALGIGFGLGVCFMTQNTNINSLLQTGVSDEMRGRVLSLYTLSFFGLAPFGSLLAGGLAQVWTLSGTVALLAAITLVGSAIIFLANPKLRKLV